MTDELGNSGRKMDAAWRRAISEGMRKAKAFAGSVGDGANYHALKAMPSNQSRRVTVAGALAGAGEGGKLVTKMIAPMMAGGTVGGAIGGFANKWAMKQRGVMAKVTADNPKLATALNKSLSTGRAVKLDGAKGLHKFMGGKVAVGAAAGAKVGAAATITRTIPVVGAALGVTGAVIGARNKEYGAAKLKQMEASAMRHETKKATTANRIRKS